MRTYSVKNARRVRQHKGCEYAADCCRGRLAVLGWSAQRRSWGDAMNDAQQWMYLSHQNRSFRIQLGTFVCGCDNVTEVVNIGILKEA